MWRLIWWALGASVWCSASHAQSLPENTNVSRESFGTIAWRVLSTGEVRGEEQFHITGHPDGSRTVMAVSRYGPRDIQRHSLYRIDAAIRPVEAALQYWIEGEWRASGTLSASGAHVLVQSRGPHGEASHTLNANGPFAVLPHQLAPDAWRVLLYDKSIGGVQDLAVYDPAPLADGPDGLLGKMTTQKAELIGPEQVIVPAGAFDCDHYRIGDSIDLYVTGPDAVLVTWRFAAIDREHILTTLTQR